MEIIAHRGVHSESIRENSREALRACIGSSASGVEIDVRITSDGICVVHHYTKLTNGDRISRLSFEQLNELDKQLMRIDEALELLDGFDGLINLEVKHLLGERDRSRGLACVEQLSSDVIRFYGDSTNNVLVSSFSLPNVRRLSKHLPQVPRAYLAPWPLSFRRAMSKAIEHECKAIHFSLAQMRSSKFSDVVGQAHEQDLKIRVYTVNTKQDFELAKRLNVDAVFTDHVDKLSKY